MQPPVGGREGRGREGGREGSGERSEGGGRREGGREAGREGERQDKGECTTETNTKPSVHIILTSAIKIPLMQTSWYEKTIS